MKHEIIFYKVSATGNDFILIDNRQLGLSKRDSDLFRQICRRRISVGADGVLLIENSPEHDFLLRYFNADGSETECGNGARSAAYFVSHFGIADSPVRFRFGRHVYEAQVEGERVRLKVPQPSNLETEVEIPLDEHFTVGGFIDTGVPHFVLFSDKVDEVDVVEYGRKYRRHDRFKPAGTNVDFVQKVSDNRIKMRTYERGVEDETLSCGTGCVASAVISQLKKDMTFPVEVVTKGGVQTVHKNRDGDYFLEGNVTLVYEGKLKGVKGN